MLIGLNMTADKLPGLWGTCGRQVQASIRHSLLMRTMFFTADREGISVLQSEMAFLAKDEGTL